jgi:hypothetical protein
MRGIEWLKEEELYLRTIANICIRLSKSYHIVHFKKKKTQTKLKIPAIIIGSFTGVASFGTSTFPKEAQRWVSVVVGLVNIGIAVLNTLDTFFKIGEDMNSAKATSEQLRKLAEDIEKELCLPEEDRPTSGIQFLRDTYTRYQQILGNAPMLTEYISYADKEIIEKKSKTMKMLKSYSPSKSSDDSPSTSSKSNIHKPKDELTMGSEQISSVMSYLAKNGGYNNRIRKSKLDISSEIEGNKQKEDIIGDIEMGVTK